jgi:hypothetical protein
MDSRMSSHMSSHMSMRMSSHMSRGAVLLFDGSAEAECRGA